MGDNGVSQTAIEDIVRNHEEIIVAAVLDGVLNTTGRMPTEDEVRIFMGKVQDGVNRCTDYLWKEKLIVRVHAPSVDVHNGKTVVRRKIEKVWEKGHKGFRIHG